MKDLTHRIIGKLRDSRFLTLDDVNTAIREELAVFNATDFQKRPGSRLLVFNNEERQYLKPLPEHPFVRAVWKELTVQKNCHICTDKRYYSVPYQFVGKKVRVRLDNTTVRIFHHDNLLCEHSRFAGSGAYTTDINHMPPNHRHFVQCSAAQFCNWARNQVGPATEAVMTAMFAARKVEEQGYKQAYAIKRLWKKHGATLLEQASEVVLREGRSPSFHVLEGIIEQLQTLNAPSSDSYAIVRGSGYYAPKGDDHD